MVLPQVAVRLLAVSCVITGVALAGGALAASSDAARAEAVAASTAPQKLAVAPEAPACARKVKVVYAGYGEAERAACPVTAKASD